MIKDIPEAKVEDIALAVVPQPNEDDPSVEDWYVYLINLKEIPIGNVLISSKGYGQMEDEKVETSELRHFLEELPAKSFARVELIMSELFAINNQYWVSFYVDNQIFDKKYVFLAESIQKSNFTTIPLVGKKGVLLS